MTVRRALVTKDAEAIKEYTNTERDNIHQVIAKCYADDPSVLLSYVSGNNGNLTGFVDTRFRSGPVSTDVSAFPAETTTGEPEEINVATYDYISQTRTNPATGFTSTTWNSWTAKPVYMETDSIIREMSFQDVLDTFIDPVIGNIVSGTTGANAGGSFFVSTSTSETNCTQLGLIFTDTVTKLSLYSAASIGTDGTYQDHVDTSSTVNYYLHKNDGVAVAKRLPLVIDYTSNGRNNPAGLREMTSAEFDDLFCKLIIQEAYDGTGNTLSYAIDGSGTTKGSAITNRSMSGVTGDHTTRQVTPGLDDYRAQEFANGTVSVKDTWRLKLDRT